VVVWDVAEREDPTIAADLVSRACLRERISRGRKQPLILNADNGNAMRAATLESRLEELGGAQVVLEAARQQRQPLLRILIQDSDIPAGLPETAFRQQG
jgi:putative transposase